MTLANTSRLINLDKKNHTKKVDDEVDLVNLGLSREQRLV